MYLNIESSLSLRDKTVCVPNISILFYSVLTFPMMFSYPSALGHKLKTSKPQDMS